MEEYYLDGKADLYFSLLCKRLQSLGYLELYQLISTAHMQVGFGYDSSSNYNETYFGHLLNFYVPSGIFLKTFDKHQEFTNIIEKEFNAIFTNPLGEYIHSVMILPDDDIAPQANSSRFYLHNKLPKVSDEDLERIWGAGTLRIFISHRDSDKIEAKNIQTKLDKFNIASFVAHEDIKVTEEWAKEILRALMTMDICLCLITDDFFESKWTNQEVGFALGRNIPVIPLKTNSNTPDGFISILQAGKYNSKSCADDITTLLLNTKSIPSIVKDSVISSIIASLRNANSWEEAIKIAEFFQYIEKITETQAQGFINVFNSNSQIHASYYLSGYDGYGKKRAYPPLYADFLNRCTDKEYIIEKQGNRVVLIEKMTKTVESNLVPF